jgi:hypothetical protein
MKQATLHVRRYVTSYGVPDTQYEVTVKHGRDKVAQESSANRLVAIAAAIDAAHEKGYEVEES